MKILGWALISLFVISLVAASAYAYEMPGAVASALSVNTIKSRLGNLTTEQANKLGALTTQRLKELSNLNQSQLAAALQQLRTKLINKADIFRKRVVAGAQFVAAQQALARARERYEIVKLAAGTKLQRLQQLNGSYQQCKNSNTTECEAIKAQVLEAAKNFTLNAYDHATEFMNKLMSRIESSQFINSTNAREALSDIDQALALLNDGRANAVAAANMPQVKDALQELKRILLKVNHVAKLHAARVVRAHVSEVFERARQMERRMELIIAKLNESGNDTSAIEARLGEFSAKVDAAKDKMNESLTAFRDAYNLRKQAQADGNVSEAEAAQIHDKLNASRTLARDAQTLLREAHAILVDIAKQVRAAFASMNRQVSDAELLDAGAITAVVAEPQQIEVEEVDTGE